MIKSDKWIRRMSLNKQMINPFNEGLSVKPAISFGQSSYGYDCRLSETDFGIFSPISCLEIDPKNFDRGTLIMTKPTSKGNEKYFIMPPHAYALGMTVEEFRLPDNVTGIALGKSTYARAGLIVNTTPLEAGWIGRLMIEFFNGANVPLRLYANEGILQVIFFEADEHCETTYASRKGKYQNQSEFTTSKI